MCVDWVDRLVTTGWKIIRTVTKENLHFGPEENRQNCDSRKSTVMRDCVETLDSDCLSSRDALYLRDFIAAITINQSNGQG
jgi:hypothetical protein